MSAIDIFDPAGRAIPFAAEGDGPAVVLIAGSGLNLSYLELLAHSVAQEDFRVVRIGSRRPSGEDVTLSDLAQDVVDVLDHLGVAQAWVGGHAFGGSIARSVALDHHDRVSGILLLGVEGSETDLPDYASVPVGARDAEVWPLQRAARSAAPLAPLPEGVPVLIIQGSADDITPPSRGDALKASAPDRVSVVTIEGGGHWFPVTHMGATSWAIEDYLDWD